MAEIRLTGVNKVYPGGTHAVHDVDLHIADGEFMIMVGPSGCAKSTILRMIAGLETLTTGTIEIGGRVVNDVAPKDRDIAMVFQSYALYPHMTVRENMAFGLRLRRMPDSEIDQRVAEAARILGLEQLLDRLPKAMSGGQRQRVAMGRAIVREPQAFLMDEPLSNLDAKLRVQMRTEIAKLHQRLRTTTVYVTHDQVEAMTLGQRICILRKGIVQQVDTPFEVYNNPANVFVGGFIGSPGMNFMSGHMVLHDGVLYLRLGDRHLPLPATVTSRLLATSDLHGRSVIVGIRPEHLEPSTPDDPHALAVDIELVEAMGAEAYAYFTSNVAVPDLSELSDTSAGGSSFVARLGAGTSAEGGAQMGLRPQLDEVHLFDPQTLLTMLSPAHEATVRARQSDDAITIATPQHQLVQAGPVAVPPAAHTTTVQPVIHLHQTFVGEDRVGATIDADPARIASVFDQPVAAPVHVQPLMPAAVGGDGQPGAAPQRPSFAHTMGAPAASQHTNAYAPPAPPAIAGLATPPTEPATAAQDDPFAPRPLVPGAPQPRSTQAAHDTPPPPGLRPRLHATPTELSASIDAAERPDRGEAPSPFRSALHRLRAEQAGEDVPPAAPMPRPMFELPRLAPPARDDA